MANWLMIIMALVSIILTAIKTNTLGFTHDESLSYLRYPQAKFIDIISYKDGFTNNHLLNTLLMKYSEMIFGNSEFALRLPNLIALLVYLYFAHQLMKTYKPIIQLSIYGLMVFNLPLLEMFSLARGYGLSFAFLMMSIYYLNHAIQDGKKYIYYFHFSALLAIMSHFTTITYYISAIGMILFIPLVTNTSQEPIRKRLLQTIKTHIIPFLLVCIALYEPIRRVTKNTFDFGGKLGLFDSTIQSIVLNTLYGISPNDVFLFLCKLLLVLFVLISVYIVGRQLQKGQSIDTKLTTSTGLIIIILAIILLQHFIMKTDYPVGRFSLYLLPILFIHIANMSEIKMKMSVKKIVQTAVASFAVLMVTVFTLKYEASYFSEWKYDSKTPDMLSLLSELKEESQLPKDPIKLGVDWVFEPCINYYRKRHNLLWLEPVTRQGLKGEYDYLYIPSSKLHIIDNKPYEVKKEYETIDMLLIQMK